MSSTSSAATSTDSPFFTVLVSPSPTQPNINNSAGPFGAQSTPLYLFTFLATLFVLLMVSSAIIMRSFFIRRRFRREIELALAEGALILPPPTAPGARRRFFGEKPKLWDTDLSNARGVRWRHITPVSARITATIPSVPSSDSIDEKARMPRSPFTELVSWVHPFTQRRPNETLELLTLTTSTPPSPGSPPESSPNEKYNVYQELDRATELQVSMLISMPDPHQPRYTRIGSSLSVKGKERSLDRDGYSEDWDDLEGVPDVVFGITRVPFRSCASD